MIPRWRVVISSITLAGIWVCCAAGSSDNFRAAGALEYQHQSSEQVTVGAKAFDNEELTADAFGKKADLLKRGVLPVLVVIENKRQKTLDLRDVEVTLVAADGRHASSVAPEDVMALGEHGRNQGRQVPLPVPLPKKKNRLNIPEIAGRAFVAKMLPPGDSASGFFYFEAKPEKGDKVYLNGLRDIPSGHEIMYFEFPIGAE